MCSRAILCLVIASSLVWTACSKNDHAKPKEAEEIVKEEPMAPEAPPTPVTYDLTAEQQALIFDTPIQTLQGADTSLASHRGKSLLIVNVASECGLTPQYEKLQSLHTQYAAQGFSVIGFPCNQFGGQEPGTPEEILAFGKDNYQVSFPLMQKLEANGDNRHPIYQALTQIKDAANEAGDVQWNFEKFVVSKDGTRITRFRPETLPDDPQVIEVLEASL